jgi:hypothetical protein
MPFNIEYSKNLIDLSPVNYKIIKCFTNFCLQYLNIDGVNFNLYLVSTKDENYPKMSLACFDLKNNDTYVRTDGRFVYDVCRSIAHELVHLQQKLNNKINMDKYTDIGGDIEDEANAVAGIICKTFIKKYNCDWIYKM